MSDDLTLGRLLGRREAFNIVAARCSAADAALLRQMRDEKQYLNHCADWDEFCYRFLQMTKSNANRIIGLLNEFGPQYFEVAQLTRISPQTYRALAPSIRDGALHANGEAIALIPENAEKVAAAVAELRKSASQPEGAAPAPPPPDPTASIHSRCQDLIQALSERGASGDDLNRIRVTVLDVLGRLKAA